MTLLWMIAVVAFVAPPQLLAPPQLSPSCMHHGAITEDRARISMLDLADAAAKPVWLAQPKKLTDDGREFAEDAWVRYGGSDAWLENLKSTLNSKVLERISGHLLATIAFAALVASVFSLDRHSMLPGALSGLVESCALPALPHEAVGSFIGLLLAFRTSQAYDRFWEARCLWDDVYGSSRSIVRLTTAAGRERIVSAGSVSADGEAAQRLSALIVGLTAAWPYSLKQHLRGERNVDELIDAATAAAACPRKSPLAMQLRAAAEQPNVPLALLECLTYALLKTRSAHGDLLWWQLDAKIEELIKILGKAERIKGTPVPLSYSRHTSRFFSVYAFTLPLALVGQSVALPLIPPIVGVVSWVIFATEEIGHIIEEPFGRGLSTDPDRPEADAIAAARSAGGEAADGEASPRDGAFPVQFEVLPLGRYCADIASDAANILGAAPTTLDEMPGGDDNLDAFDDVS